MSSNSFVLIGTLSFNPQNHVEIGVVELLQSPF